MADLPPTTRIVVTPNVDGTPTGGMSVSDPGQFAPPGTIPFVSSGVQDNGFNIQRFEALTEGKNGFVRPSKFLARIPLPSCLQGINMFQETNRDLSFWCDTASLPGAALQTRDVPRYGYGAIEKRPTRNIFQDLNFVFYADGGSDPFSPNIGTNWNFFTTWVRSIVNFDMSQGLMMPDGRNGSTGNIQSQPYEVSYPGEYKVDIEVHVFRQDGTESHAVVLRDAFPTYVQEAVVRWGDDGNILQIPVLFAFTDWYLTFPLSQG